MKITAEGWNRSAVGPHDVIETKPSAVSIAPDGFVTIEGKSKLLALSDHFRIKVKFSSEDIYALAATAARAPLEAKIDELKREIHELKRVS